MEVASACCCASSTPHPHPHPTPHPPAPALPCPSPLPALALQDITYVTGYQLAWTLLSDSIALRADQIVSGAAPPRPLPHPTASARPPGA